MLYDARKSIAGENEANEFQIELFEAITESLKQLIDEGQFNNMTIFISISDDDRAVGVENYSAEKLCRDDLYEEFINRYKS